MKNLNENNNISTVDTKSMSKEELSTYNLCCINGCSQTKADNEETAVIGFYH